MNEAPGGTPNPLNPNRGATPLDANPSEPMQAVNPNQPQMRPGGPAGAPMGAPMRIRPTGATMGARPTGSPMGARPTGATPTPMNSATSGPHSLDPMDRPMERAPSGEPVQPKKNKSLMVGIIVSIFIAVGCGVAAILIALNMNKVDPVTAAVQKLITGEVPENIAIEGTIDSVSADLSSPISDMKISVKTDAVTNSLLNSTTATLSANLRNGGSFSIDLGEVYAANGELYLKVDGIKKALEDPYLFSEAPKIDGTEQNEEIAPTEELDCVEGENCPTGEVVLQTDSEIIDSINSLLATFSVIDGEWVRITTDELNTLSSEDIIEKDESFCSIDLITDLRNNSNALIDTYNKNPFILSSSENIPIESEQNPIYQVILDNKNFTAFINNANEISLFNNLYGCLGYEDSTIDANNLMGYLQELPEIYVEIDDNYNFTRLYMEPTIDDGENKVTVDFSFSYPANTNIAEPTEYQDLTTVLQSLSEKTYELETAETSTTEGEF